LGVDACEVSDDRRATLRVLDRFAGVDRQTTMSMWVWILVGVGGVVTVSLQVGVAVAVILETIGHDFSKLLELEPWASSPLTRAKDSAAQETSRHLGRAPIPRL
jgi:hypothetical protein